MKGVAVVSANIGRFEKPIVHNPQFINCDFHTIRDGDDFPLRLRSLTPRLQARIVKTHMWQFVPDYEYYLWIDSSCKLKSIIWFLDQLDDSDIAVFRHPHRETVQEEADYLKKRLDLEKQGKKQEYILPRYENEDIDGQLEVVDPTADLYASTAFVYKDSPKVREAMQEWWYHISRYHSIDQLSLPWCIKDLKVSVIQSNYENCDGMEFVRNK